MNIESCKYNKGGCCTHPNRDNEYFMCPFLEIENKKYKCVELEYRPDPIPSYSIFSNEPLLM
ncbi:MAG: hypothetical protein J7K26_02780 [Candidatus Aenigmarchaeota archaeon]|nr:hypothetical protein [Candidatus Aenigmarchaeota archaeon]